MSASQRTVRELCNMGFPEDKACEAVGSIGDSADLEAAISWLLDHGEEDKGGAVQFKLCPHIDHLGKEGLLKPGQLMFGRPCVHGCQGNENWVCLLCGETRCGRYSKRHSLEHWETSKRAEEAALTVGDVQAGRSALGHCLALGLGDLSIWCYECSGYVEHEALRPLRQRMEQLKFGEVPQDAGAGSAGGAGHGAEGPVVVGTPMEALPVAMHGRLGEATWPAPRVVRVCDEAARPGYKTRRAHEYLDSEEVLKAKVAVVAGLVRQSQQCVAYTGAGISTASGISDYATKASDSIAKAGVRTVSPWEAQPTLAHRVLVAMHWEGHLKHWVQQNHDGLPQKAGYPQEELNEIHGAWYDPSNPVVPMDGTLRADLIEWMLEWEERADLCLALGTSMVGMNADRMAVAPAQRAKRGKALGTVIVALQQTQYDAEASVRIFAPMDRVMELLAQELSLRLDPSPATSGPPTPANHVFKNLPYAPDGRRSTEHFMTLDLREGSRVRIVNQQSWDQDRHGGEGVVLATQDALCAEGHYAIRLGQGESAPLRVLGRWWLEAAREGRLARLPVVPAAVP